VVPHLASISLPILRRRLLRFTNGRKDISTLALRGQGRFRELIILIYTSFFPSHSPFGCMDGVWSLSLRPFHGFFFRLGGRSVGPTVLHLPIGNQNFSPRLGTEGYIRVVWKSGWQAKKNSFLPFHWMAVYISGRQRLCFDPLGFGWACENFPKARSYFSSSIYSCFHTFFCVTAEQNWPI